MREPEEPGYTETHRQDNPRRLGAASAGGAVKDWGAFLAEPRKRPSELERARIRKVLGSTPSRGAAPDELVSELRAVRDEVSSLRDLLTERMGGEVLNDEVLTRAQVAQLLGVCTESVTKLVRTEKLPCKRVGKEYRFLRSEVVAWFATRDAEVG